MSYPPPSQADQQKVIDWRADPTKHGKHRFTCPCGFVGHAHNIRAHRSDCHLWTLHALLPTYLKTPLPTDSLANP